MRLKGKHIIFLLLAYGSITLSFSTSALAIIVFNTLGLQRMTSIYLGKKPKIAHKEHINSRARVRELNASLWWSWIVN